MHALVRGQREGRSRIGFNSGISRVERRLLLRRQQGGRFSCYASQSGKLRREDGVPFQTHEASQVLHTHGCRC